eukprot:3768601-Rhodomonas_salina.1
MGIRVATPISIPLRYAVSVTDVVYGATPCLCKALRGSPCAVLRSCRVLRDRYAVSGTEIAYGATRHPRTRGSRQRR